MLQRLIRVELVCMPESGRKLTVLHHLEVVAGLLRFEENLEVAVLLAHVAVVAELRAVKGPLLLGVDEAELLVEAVDCLVEDELRVADLSRQ